MARRWYEPVSGDLQLWVDPQVFVEAQDQAALAAVQAYQAASDLVRTELAKCQAATLEDYDAYLQDQAWELQDRLDYYGYDDRVENLTVKDGAWYSPEAVESFCGESGLINVSGRDIDGNLGTFWRHAVDERHSVVYRLRDHPKRVTKVRWRYGGNESDNERLQNIDIHVARELANIDDPGNVIETGLNIVWPTPGDVGVEHTLASPKQQARYVKLVFDTQDAGNVSQIREFEVWVGVRLP